MLTNSKENTIPWGNGLVRSANTELQAVAKNADADYPAAMIGQRVRARAPLRLGFGGGTTDVSPYCDAHGGAVLNAAIDLFAHVTIEPRIDDRVSLVAADRGITWTGKAALPLKADADLRLLEGVYVRCMRDFAAGQAIALTLTSYADCPPGSGLGSSSALVVAMVEAMRRFLDVELSPDAVARLAFQIEREDLGLAGGRQDQWAAAFGGVNMMRFETDGRVVVETVPAPPPVLRELESSLVLYFTGVSRESAAIIEEQAANMRSGAPRSLEGLHALKAGAFQMREALLAGDLARFGALVDAGWSSKKLTAHNISSAGIDEVYAAAKTFGVFGGKVSGAGGGGFMMFLVEPTRREALKRLLTAFGGMAQGCRLEERGAESWIAP
jgi:D-glycero-alpha-D-manno-heptose-7-phosphate kinase